MIKSVSESQHEILRDIMSLYCPQGFDADITYGNGCFYKDVKAPDFKFDIDPQMAGVEKACSTSIPCVDGAFQSVVFDPPFLTYVRNGREHSKGKPILSRRFSGYWRYEELAEHYKSTLKECSRILVDGGLLVFKCQDIIHNHKMFCTHANVIEWARDNGLVLNDLFILTAKTRMPSPNRKGKQKHARIFHSYFLVFRKG